MQSWWAGLGHPMDPVVSVQKSSWSRRGNQKSFTLTILWNSAKLVKISPGIIARQHRTDSETDGIAKITVCRIKERTSAVLLQSGLDEKWWADSMECYTYLRNVTDLLSDEKTPYERRFGQPFKGPIIPFGSLVEYHPITAKDQSRIHQFGKKVLPGLFLGYALYAGRIWKGDVLIADLEELETMDASEIHAKRLYAKEVIFPAENGKFIFPVADGRIKICWRRSGTENIHLDTAATNSRSGQKTHLTKKGQRIDCNISNCVPFGVLGLSTSSSTTPTPCSSSSQDSVFDVSRYTENPSTRKKWKYEWRASVKPDG